MVLESYCSGMFWANNEIDEKYQIALVINSRCIYAYQICYKWSNGLKLEVLEREEKVNVKM